LNALYAGADAPWTDDHVIESEYIQPYRYGATPRGSDPAAIWLAESGNIAELATFPHAVRVGSTNLS
ncbi:hypothetical protein AB4Z22_42365, partial [Paenibacillus sp. TAF58]